VAAQALGLVGSIGKPTPRHLGYARDFLRSLPSELRDTAREPEGAIALVVALLLGDPGGPRVQQLEQVRAALGDPVAHRAERMASWVKAAGPVARLPLLDLTLPALRTLDRDRSAKVGSSVSALIRADGKIHPFEFALFHVLRRNLAGPRDQRSPSLGIRSVPIQRLRAEAVIVLSALARSGANEDESVQQAYEAGAIQLFGDPLLAPTALPAHAVQLDRVDDALGRLAGLRPADLRTLLHASLVTIQADRQVSIAELEMLRAVAEALDAPMPPIAPDRAT